MARSTSKGKKGFIWLPREASASWSVKINGDDVTTDLLTGTEFSKSLCPGINQFTVLLINADGAYSDKYSQGQVVQLYLDLSDGSTLRFEGKIDKAFNQRQGNIGYVMNISGAGYSKDLIEIKVTEKYEGNKSVSDILLDLQSNYLTGFLSDYSITDTLTSTATPTINWDEKPFWDCISDICKIGAGEAYISDTKAIVIRDQNSNENNDEAVVWNDTLLDASGLGKQSISSKNKVKVYGDDGEGLPVIYISENAGNQSTLSMIKEEVIHDTKVTSYEQAQELADAELEYQNTSNELEGDCESLILPSLEAGDKIWFSDPTMKLHQQSRVYRFVHKLPEERTMVSIGRVRKLPQLFKKRVENELALATVTNPYKMTRSWNVPFNAESELTSKDSNVAVSNGAVKLSSGTEGIFSLSKTFDIDISQIHLLMAGSNLKNVIIEVSTDSENYDTLDNEELNSLTTPGKSLIARCTITNINTEIRSIAFLCK